MHPDDRRLRGSKVQLEALDCSIPRDIDRALLVRQEQVQPFEEMQR
jgi:hypothetical protein